MGKTADQLSKSELAHYREATQKRKKQKEKKLEKRYINAQRIAHELADILYRDFSAQKVILFGSLTKREFFNEKSDIDLAVIGLPSDIFYASLTAIDSFSKDYKVDLIDLGDCVSKLKDIIIKEGVVL